MKRRTHLILLLILAVVGGCTPLSEDIARRANNGPRNANAVLQSSITQGTDPIPESTLDPATLTIIRNYGPAIRRYAERYGFDWRLILAIMKQESRFSATAESKKGASGLMQMMPVTSEEVARVLDLEDLRHPTNNIRGGVFYLRKLHNFFEGAQQADRIKLTLAAYNAGVGRIYDAQEVAAYLHDNPTKWQAVRDALPLLSKRYYTLHRNIWQEEKPRSGWFGNARQTVTYVDSIMNYYDEYKLVLN